MLSSEFLGKLHFWIKLVTKALRKGALADTMIRFPWIAKLVQVLMPKAIEALIQDTRTHEAHTLALIERWPLVIPTPKFAAEVLTWNTRRLNNPSKRPDFLTRILEDQDASSISKVQLAAHASDFV